MVDIQMTPWLKWGEPLPDEIPCADIDVSGVCPYFAPYGFAFAYYARMFKPEWGPLTREAYILQCRTYKWYSSSFRPGATDWRQSQWRRMHQMARQRFKRREAAGR